MSDEKNMSTEKARKGSASSSKWSGQSLVSPATGSFSAGGDQHGSSAKGSTSNPLAGYTVGELEEMGAAYAQKYELTDEEDIQAFRQGAVCAQSPSCYETYPSLSGADKEIMGREVTHPWSQPRLLYLLIVICSTCAAVQGMDETVINGAQLFFSRQFGISGDSPRSTWLLGLVNSAPYMCNAFIGCWMTVPFNHWLGRRGTVFLCALICTLSVVWQALTNTWWHMFIARFVLGFGIGPMSATVPMYAAETAPPKIRGALVMQWQVWTAFGIMLGYASDLALYSVSDVAHITGLNWRLMLASAMLPAIVVCCFVFGCPESPRWYMGQAQHKKAYRSMVRLRFSKVQAARDVFFMHVLLEAEAKTKIGSGSMAELIRVPRNRRAVLASEILMFMQQFCGVNVIAYYSSAIFKQAKFSDISALSASLGFGVINFLFALPAMYTIDSFGRRNLLLSTFPFMSLFLFFTGFSFWIPEETHHTARIACITLGIYLFGIVYSTGEGPVPFTYSAEAYPQYVRSYGMSLATATTWFFNFVLSITWPSLHAAFKDQGAFSWYAVWNMVGWFLVLLFVPETKGKTLEQLDQVFSVPTHVQAAYGLRQVPYFFKRFIFRQKVEAPTLVEKREAEPGEAA